MKARLLVLITAALALTGCTGIPHSGKPQSVQTIGVDEPAQDQIVGPEKNADPRGIVNGFLNANGAGALARQGALQFLTLQAKTHWDASTITVVSDPRVGVFKDNSVVVTGTTIGTLDRTGVYSAYFNGNGSSISYTGKFGMKQVGGQWRIDSPPNGLVLDTSQFDNYKQRSIYFFDGSEQHLVPDPRWSPLLDVNSANQPGTNALASWLIAQVALGPRDPLQSAETTELPAQVDPTHVTVSVAAALGGLTKIEIPGAGQLSSTSRNRLAAQIAATLVPQVATVGQMEITDGGTPVTIPAADGAVFNSDAVTAPFVPVTSAVGLYYINSQGGVDDESGTPLVGSVGNGGYGLESVALAQRNGVSGLLVAGTRKNGTFLDIGTVGVGGKVIVSKLPAPKVGQHLSRPDWAPGLKEVWVGDGNALYRVQSNGSAQPVQLTTPTGKIDGLVTAVRLSPEGSRVALVLTNPTDGSSRVWVGIVLRGGTAGVQVVSLAPITPQDTDITDVAWNDQLKLFAVGKAASTGVPGVYEVQVDGSLWVSHSIGNLPAGPDTITASPKLVAAVSAGGEIWKQNAGQNAGAWVSPQGTDAHGTAPVYSS